jgi:restriction endonuclease
MINSSTGESSANLTHSPVTAAQHRAVVTDSRAVASPRRIRAYVKNQGLGFEVPYLLGSTPKRYLPDFIVQVDDGHDDLLNLIVEIKGYRGEDAKEKANTMDAYWVPGVNNLGKFGRWGLMRGDERK